jgi:hypothetical protein
LRRHPLQPSDQAAAPPKFNVISVYELAGVFEGGIVVSGDEHMRLRDVTFVIDTIGAVFLIVDTH